MDYHEPRVTPRLSILSNRFHRHDKQRCWHALWWRLSILSNRFLKEALEVAPLAERERLRRLREKLERIDEGLEELEAEEGEAEEA